MARTQANLSTREQLQKRYHTARMDLLIVILMTVVNVIILLAGGDTMFLFSISVPYYAVVMGYFMADGVMLTTGCVIAAVMLAVYLLCWLFSKKRSGWMVAALVFFALDTLLLGGVYLLAEAVSGVADIVFHCFVVYALIAGIHSAAKLKKLPPEAPAAVEAQPGQSQEPQFSTPLRRAEEDVKHRVLLEGTYGGRQIIYRRVKRVNELVINGYVYDEYNALMETSHCLSARIDGHLIEMGFDQGGYSYFKVDGVMITKKIRLF